VIFTLSWFDLQFGSC